MLPDLSAMSPWCALLAAVLTTIATTLIALARVLLRALPQTSSDRLEWWKTFLAYRLDRRRAKLAASPPGPAGGDEDSVDA